jgi:hypothetical protein
MARSSVQADSTLLKELGKLAPLLKPPIVLTKEEVIKVLVDEKMEQLGLKKKEIALS